MAKAGVAWSPRPRDVVMTSTAFDSSHGKEKIRRILYAAATINHAVYRNSLQSRRHSLSCCLACILWLVFRIAKGEASAGST